MSYRILIQRRAQKELAQLPKQEYERIRAVVQNRHGTQGHKVAGSSQRERAGDYELGIIA